MSGKCVTSAGERAEWMRRWLRYCVLSRRFRRELQALPALPEMVFPDSWLRLDHVSGCGLAFYALDALRRVDATGDPLKVAAAEDWSKSRSDSSQSHDCQVTRSTREESLAKVKGVVRPFDWTFSTDYSGTLLSQCEASCIQVSSEAAAGAGVSVLSGGGDQ